jgi:Ca-activated chloride channel family protein
MIKVWLVLPAVVLGSAILSAQLPLYTSGVALVHIGVSVVGDGGEFVADLTAEDFELYEDGQPQEIRYFSRGLESDSETMPMHLGLLFDTSESMEQDARFAKTAAIKFLNTLTYASDITLVDFDTQVRVGRYAQNDFPRLVERIRNRKSTGLTALYDALGVYLDGTFEQDGRKVLLLYSDGDDTRSRMPFDDTLDLVRASDVTVYAVGFQKNLRSSVRMKRRMRLEQLAELTGGRCYFPNSADDLDGIYEQITRELNARYSIGYVSTNERTDGTWREIGIKLASSRPELKRVKVRNRQGYFAPYLEANDNVSEH